MHLEFCHSLQWYNCLLRWLNVVFTQTHPPAKQNLIFLSLDHLFGAINVTSFLSTLYYVTWDWYQRQTWNKNIQSTTLEIYNFVQFHHRFEEQFNIKIQTIFNSQMCVLFSRNNKRSGTSLYRLVFREKFNAKQFSKPKWDSTSATSILFIIFLITP